MKEFQHTFNGVEYTIIVEKDLLGLCLDDISHTLTLIAPLTTSIGLQTAVHEAIHAEFPMLPENVVNVVGIDIGTYLWKLGFRYQPPKPKGKK
jgi:hypothetical protein